MDEQRFDAITGAIGAPSRRAMFRALAGGAMAMLGADVPAEELGIA